MLNELRSTLIARGLTESQLVKIAQMCTWETLVAGQQLCTIGEIINKLYIVQRGCIKGIAGTNGHVIGYVNAGETLGQYSVISKQPLMVNLVAEFDTVMLTLDRNSVLSLMEEIPLLEQNLRNSFHKRFRTFFQERKKRRFAPSVAFVRNPDLRTEIVSKICQRLIARGERLVVLSNDPVYYSDFETAAPQASEQLRSQILALCLKFDRVIIDTPSDPGSSFFDLLKTCDEVFWFFRVGKTDDLNLLDRFFEIAPDGAKSVKRICLLPEGQNATPVGIVDQRIKKRDFVLPARGSGASKRMHQQGIERITRHLCDVRIGLSMSGGGARGLVHFGILRALDKAGISFDFMSGTSAGAMFGLSYAAGLDTEYLIDAYTRNLTPPKFFRWLPNGDRWYLVWKFRTRGWDKMLREYFDFTFEQLPIPFSTVAVDLVSGRQMVTESGDIIEAMLGSLNLPLIAKPILRDGMALVDGGVLNNLPADVLVRKNADYVVGVAVANDLEPEFGPNRPGMKTSEMKPAGKLETVFRILEVMGTGANEVQRAGINMLINPDTTEFSFTDFTQGEQLAEVGEATMDKLIPQLRHEIDELMRFNSSDDVDTTDKTQA